MGNGTLMLAQFQVERALVEFRLRHIGPEGKRLPETGGRRLVLAEGHLDAPQVVVRIGAGWIDVERLSEQALRLSELAPVGVDDGQVLQRSQVAWIGGKHGLEQTRCFGDAARLVQADSSPEGLGLRHCAPARA